jgi:hypothetical protein
MPVGDALLYACGGYFSFMLAEDTLLLCLLRGYLSYMLAGDRLAHVTAGYKKHEMDCCKWRSDVM